MYNNNIRTDSEIHQFINSEFRNGRLRLEWPLADVKLIWTITELYSRQIMSIDFDEHILSGRQHMSTRERNG